ncbi:MAG: hypothetical protein SXA11_06810 [Cyanobacteriota bacterium]|nr:hypothetical protein [Cyanobacteriota bacterium]
MNHDKSSKDEKTFDNYQERLSKLLDDMSDKINKMDRQLTEIEQALKDRKSDRA